MIQALERDGFLISRNTRPSGFVYSHQDGRNTFIHCHTGGETLTRKTLASVLRATKWTEDDLRRLRLL